MSKKSRHTVTLIDQSVIVVDEPQYAQVNTHGVYISNSPSSSWMFYPMHQVKSVQLESI